MHGCTICECWDTAEPLHSTGTVLDLNLARALDGEAVFTMSQCTPCTPARNVCVIGDVLRTTLGGVGLFCEKGLCVVVGVHGCTIWERWDTAEPLHSAGTV